LALNPDGSVLAAIHQDIFKKGEGRVAFIGNKDNNEIADVTVRGDPASAVCNWVTNSIFSGERPIATNVVGGTDR